MNDRWSHTKVITTMKKKYLLIAMSAFFLLTCATSCNNGKSANDKNDTEEVTEKNMENGGKDDA